MKNFRLVGEIFLKCLTVVMAFAIILKPQTYLLQKNTKMAKKDVRHVIFLWKPQTFGVLVVIQF
ncbi:MAG: hypothetical protein ACE5DL_02540 [Nitrosopumilaceae archaeon]